MHLGKILSTLVLAAIALQGNIVGAHPGDAHNHVEDSHTLAARRLFAMNAKLSYDSCKDSEPVRRLQDRLAARRLQKVNDLRDELQRRRRLAASDVLAKDHKADVTVTNTSTVTKATLFGNSPTCVLQPTVTHGPYYVKGELIRKDIRETQPGIDLYTEILVLDTSTCKPVADYYVDFWHCNSTGVYSGVIASTNGNSNDKTNLDATFARGLYPTDTDGVVQFLTKFPGYYAGRTTHVHVMGNHGGTVLANKTYSGGSVSSIGQLFFDQKLLTGVAATTVYAANKQQVTLNSADNIFSESAKSFDPVVNYVYLGEKVEDGIFSWISIAVDLTATKSVSAAATLTATGGVASAGSTSGTKTSTGTTGGSSSLASRALATQLLVVASALLAGAFVF